MTRTVLPEGAIAVPYDRSECEGEFGWLWTAAHRGEPARWHLVSTWLPDGIDAEPVIRFHDAGDGHPLDEDAAETWAGCPYLTCPVPPSGPRAGLEAQLRLPGGGTVTLTHAAPGPEADRLAREAVALLRDGTGAALTQARAACRAARDEMYRTLQDDLEASAPMADGVPQLAGLDAEDIGWLGNRARVIAGLEAVIGRDLPVGAPDWLAGQLDWLIRDGEVEL